MVQLGYLRGKRELTRVPRRKKMVRKHGQDLLVRAYSGRQQSVSEKLQKKVPSGNSDGFLSDQNQAFSV